MTYVSDIAIDSRNYASADSRRDPRPMFCSAVSMSYAALLFMQTAIGPCPLNDKLNVVTGEVQHAFVRIELNLSGNGIDVKYFLD